MRALKLHDCTPTGPSVYLLWTVLPAASATVATNSSTLTYPGHPMLPAPCRQCPERSTELSPRACRRIRLHQQINAVYHIAHVGIRPNGRPVAPNPDHTIIFHLQLCDKSPPRPFLRRAQDAVLAPRSTCLPGHNNSASAQCAPACHNAAQKPSSCVPRTTFLPDTFRQMLSIRAILLPTTLLYS
jgi:hypothetical protein